MVLDRYIARTVIQGCLVACFIVLSIFIFVDFVSQLSDVGIGDYGVVQAAIYVLLRLPQRLYQLSSTILLLGGILSLGALAANSELIVMRASGITTLKITRLVLQTGLIIAILVALLGEYVVPASTRLAKNFRAQAMEKKLMVGGADDIWARDANRYVNVKSIMPNHQLQQIHIYELNEQHQLSSMTYAERAQYLNDSWVLHDVKRSTISTAGIETVSEKTLILKRLILLELFSVLELESQEMSARELFIYSQYLQDNNLANSEYMLQFWIKVFTPLTCLAMLLVAMPLVFATSPRSGGVGQRIMLAVLIGVGYFVINNSINHLGLALGVAPVLSVSLPLFLVVAIGFYFLRRVN